MARIVIDADAASTPQEQAKQIRDFVAARRNRPAIIDADSRQMADEEKLGRVI